MTTHAFTLGVNTYKDPLIPPLGCCERDAREFNGLLKERFGFDAHYLEERFTEPIEERIESLGKHLKPGDVFIFYFSGHGKAHQDDHYLLLPGARLAAFESGAVAVSGVLSYRNLKHITSGSNWRGVHRLFIIDACRSHLTSKKSVGEPVSFDGEYLLKDPRRSARRPEPGDENLTLLNSCALGACAVELPGEGHGIFTAALLDLMRGRQAKGGQDGVVIDSGFVTTLGETMTAKASRVGLPPEVLHQPALVGEGLRLVSDLPDAVPVDDGDEVDWVLAKAKDTLEALESYVRSHPRGAHVKEAVARIAELSQQARDALAREANAQRVAAERAAEEKRRQEQGQEHAKPLAEELERKVNAERIAAEEKRKVEEQEAAEAAQRRAAWARKQQKAAEAASKPGGKGTWLGAGFVLVLVVALGGVALFGKKEELPASSAPAASAMPKVGQELKDCDICPVLVVLPKGEFVMGSPSSELERSSDEGPQHRVKIDYGLAVGKYEVSQREWAAVMGSNPSDFKGEDLPVESVSWEDVQTYIKKLNARTGEKYGYRLLSESEWEYAARAGTSTPFNTGQTISTAQANFNGDYTYNGSVKGEYRGKTMPVGSFSANAYGLHNMHGNVREWVEDCWHEDYTGSPPVDGSAWVSSCKGVGRVLRGGSWHGIPWSQRSASRGDLSPDNRSDFYGFRLTRTL